VRQRFHFRIILQNEDCDSKSDSWIICSGKRSTQKSVSGSVHVGIATSTFALNCKNWIRAQHCAARSQCRRKSGWTLSTTTGLTFSKGIGRLQSEIYSLVKTSRSTSCISAPWRACQPLPDSLCSVLWQYGYQIHLCRPLDFRDLDVSIFKWRFRSDLQVRSPSKQKFNHQLEVGYQQMEKISTIRISWWWVLRYGGMDKKTLEPAKRILASNSLPFAATGCTIIGRYRNLPIDAKKGRAKDIILFTDR